MATAYLLHFSKPLPQPNNKRGTCARHYLGITDDLDERIRHHAEGNGSHICAALKARGGTFALVRTWENVTRANELELKRQRNNPRLCYLCTKRQNAKTKLHGNNKTFKGWGSRQNFAKSNLVAATPAPVVAVEYDELPF